MGCEEVKVCGDLPNGTGGSSAMWLGWYGGCCSEEMRWDQRSEGGSCHMNNFWPGIKEDRVCNRVWTVVVVGNDNPSIWDCL